MSAGAGTFRPMCSRCGKNVATRVNRLIGGCYCAPCDDFVAKPDPKLEQCYNRRVQPRKELETK